MKSSNIAWRKILAACACALAVVLVQLPSFAIDRELEQQETSEWSKVEELWYVLELAGGKAGWMSSLIEKNDKCYRTTNRTHMSIGRGATPVTIEMESAFVETLDGRPVKIDIMNKTGKQPVISAWEFAPDHVVITTTQGDRVTTRKEPLLIGEWMPPMALDRYCKEQRKARTKAYSVRTIAPETGPKPVTITSTFIEMGETQGNGQATPVSIWRSKSDSMPGIVTTEQFDENGTMVLQEVPMPGLGKVRTRLTTKQEAKAEGGAIPELLFATVIKPDKPIGNHLKATKAKLRLKVKEGEMVELPTAGAQRFERGADGKTAILTINMNEPVQASESERTDRAFVESSSTVNSDDAMVKKLASSVNRSLGGDAGLLAKADALRKKVNSHISKKGMETAFATAAETAITHEGDCSEHGVLLCAMLRAEGIPARVATGLVYADAFAGAEGIFGWHMWTQALIDGKWIDLDATLPVRYNAAHVLTATSSLADGLTGAEMMTVMQLIGNLEIEVLEVQYE